MERKDGYDEEELFEPLPFTLKDALVSLVCAIAAVVSYYLVFK